MRRFAVSVLLGAMIVGCSANAPAEAPVTSPASPAAAAAQSSVRQLTPAEFAAELSAGRFAINVHTPNEGSLPGTDLALPFDQISTRRGELPSDPTTPLAIYCMTGNMSAIAGETLTGLGYTDIVELRGGMQAWQAAGQPMLAASG